ncbi:MmgE/PrpD family protein [Rhizobiales bacterium]|uniref:MmgE/PrpD family protein n=1 Tax=Hongsoonwoonella zoysiae TaxID=2821844 RepID=UPI001560938D|nr:MmgE/PrpD family protein [Hongsoonwoonella zoysiae]NRG19975.1 MmgE/PrpD family protein [Hongsoonwoonella zoysiae]
MADGITAQLAEFICSFESRLLSPDQILTAKSCILDWSAVALAGRDEPVSRIVREMASSEGGTPEAMVIGLADRLPARTAALSNGTTSHALDYDDTHFDHIGHSSVGIFPAVLALGEALGRDGREVLDAFVIGLEVACRVGRYLGNGHYRHGFHQTATAGAFGAAAASARLLRLDEERCGHTLGLVSTRASGLKSQFGTMGKPFHAGLAASNGVEAAKLASLGFISNPQGLECVQGFADTHAGEGDAQTPFDGLGQTFRFDRVQFKHHACCHGTHAPIDALKALRSKIGPEAAQARSIVLRVHPQWLRVCNILSPATGLEAKFSFRLTSAMALAGRDTAALETFCDAACADPDLAQLRDRVTVETDDALGSIEALAIVELPDGRHLEHHCDLAEPVDAALTRTRLVEKAEALIGHPAAATLLETVDTLDTSERFTLPDVLASLGA